jgi:hypothetical protein
MSRYDWNETAREFAGHVGQYRSLVERGAVSVKFVEEESHQVTEEGPVVVGVFSNDNYSTDDRAQRLVELVRDRLKECDAEELGFGLSRDGATWAMLVSAEKGCCQTSAGRAFQREMLKNDLEEVVCDSWRELTEAPMGSALHTFKK